MNSVLPISTHTRSTSFRYPSQGAIAMQSIFHTAVRCFVLCIVLLGLLVTPFKSALAQTFLLPPDKDVPAGTIVQGYRWEFSTDFGSKLPGNLLVEYGVFLWTGQQWIPQGKIMQSVSPMPCWAEGGTIPIKNGYAIFDGNASLACEFDLITAFAKAGVLVPDVLPHPVFTMEAQVRNVALSEPAVLFSHPQAEFAILTGNPKAISLRTALGPYEAVSNGAVPPQSENILLSTLDCLLNNCLITQRVNGMVLGNGMAGPLEFPTAPTTIHIGQGLQGEIRQVIVDPPFFSN